MPRKDIYHESVRIALEKDGWTVTDDPLQIAIDETTIFIDLSVEPTYFAEREGEQIAIEIKSFRLQSSITSMYEALGKYCIYRTALRLDQSPFKLYLAVPEPTFDTFFQRRLIQEAINEYQVNLIIYNFESNTIVRWIKQ